MESLLGLVRGEWGSLRDYARDAGASDDALAELAARLA